MTTTRVATFDCYGTLIDWEGGVGAFLYELARHQERDPPPARELRERWEALQFERLQHGWRSYREILEHSLRHLEVEFDGVTVASDCRAYKPSTVPFEHALREIDVPHEQILHVAFGFKYDIGPAQRLGLRTAWVNRKQEVAPGAERPDHEWPDLWPLARLGG